MTTQMWLFGFLIFGIVAFFYLQRATRERRKRDQITLYLANVKPALEEFGFEMVDGTESPEFVEAIFEWKRVTTAHQSTGFPSMPDLLEPIIEQRDDAYLSTMPDGPLVFPERPDHHFWINAQVTITNKGNRLDMGLALKDREAKFWDYLLSVNTPSSWLTVPRLRTLFVSLDSVMQTQEKRFVSKQPLTCHNLIYGATSKKYLSDLPLVEVQVGAGAKPQKAILTQYYPN